MKFTREQIQFAPKGSLYIDRYGNRFYLRDTTTNFVYFDNIEKNPGNGPKTTVISIHKLQEELGYKLSLFQIKIPEPYDIY